MFDKLGDLIQRLESSGTVHRDDPALMSALASAYLAREVRELHRAVERVTSASDAIPGGYALRVVSTR